MRVRALRAERRTRMTRTAVRRMGVSVLKFDYVDTLQR